MRHDIELVFRREGASGLSVELAESGRVLVPAGSFTPDRARLLELEKVFADEAPADRSAWRAGDGYGAELWSSVPETIRTRLLGLTKQVEELRIMLRCDSCPEVHGFLWETIRQPDATPVANGRWEWLRLLGDGKDRDRADAPSLKVLFLVGAQSQLLAAPPTGPQVLSSFAALRRLAGEQQLDWVLSAATATVSMIGESFEVAAANRVTQEQHVLDLVRKGGFHVVHFIGHSDAAWTSDAAGATHLLFERGSNDGFEVSIAKLADAMRASGTVLFVAHNCAGRLRLAADLLRAVDHVITMSGFVAPQACEDFARAFYKTLAATNRVGPAMRAGRQALWLGGDHLADFAWMPAHWARIADDTVFDAFGIAISRFCERQADRLARLRNRFGLKLSFSIDDVFVEVAVQERPKGHHERPPSLEAPESRIRRFPDLLDDAPARWIVRGEPGAGKTTSLRQLARAIGLDKHRRRVPIFVSLPAIVGKGVRGGKGFAAHVHRDFPVPALEEALWRYGKRGKLALFLDAWDELPGKAERDEANLLITSILEDWPEVAVIVTARTATEPGLDRFEFATVQPLDAEGQQDLLSRRFEVCGEDAASAQALATEVGDALRTGGRATDELAGNPLLLSFVADLAMKRRREGRPPAEVAALRRHELFRDVLDLVIEGEYADKTARDERSRIVEPALARALLRHVAWNLSCRPAAQAENLTALEAIAGSFPDLAALRHANGCWTNQKLFECIAERTGLLVPADEADDARWSFMHRNLQEALTAEHWDHVVLRGMTGPARIEAVLAHLKQMVIEGKAQVSESGADQGERPEPLDFWTEPTALLAGWMDDDSLVTSILEDGPEFIDLGLRVMRAVDHLSPAVVSAVLHALPPWKSEQKRRGFGDPGPRVDAYEIIAVQARSPSLTGLIEAMKRHAGLRP